MAQHSDFIGGNIALDFVNTVDGIRSGAHIDGLETYADLLQWAFAGGVIEAERHAVLQAAAGAEPQAAARVLDEAKALREAMHNLFHAVTHGHVRSAADLACLNGALAASAGRAEIVDGGDGFTWRWVEDASLDRPLWPVARAAGDLLASGALHRLHECASDTCGWLFLDVSKAGRRRWCDMAGCGNRAKVRRHRQRRERSPSPAMRDPTPKRTT